MQIYHQVHSYCIIYENIKLCRSSERPLNS